MENTIKIWLRDNAKRMNKNNPPMQWIEYAII